MQAAWRGSCLEYAKHIAMHVDGILEIKNVVTGHMSGSPCECQPELWFLSVLPSVQAFSVIKINIP